MPITGPQRSETAYAWALSVQGLLRVDLAGLYFSLPGVDQPAAGIGLRAAGLRPVAVARTRQSAYRKPKGCVWHKAKGMVSCRDSPEG